MFIDKSNRTVLGGGVALLLIFTAGVIAIATEKPVGSISGKIAVEEAGFNLKTYDIRKNKVYALAVGPQGGDIIERGVWVKPDGTFQINQLPVGEYSLQVRAAGFSTANQQDIFVDEAKLTRLKNPVALAILEPSVNIASNSRVFTSRETPHFWLNATGSDEATVRIYRKDVLALLKNSNAKNGLEFSSDLSIYKPYQQKQGRLFSGEKPVKTLSRRLSRDSEDWSHAEFKLDKPLPLGEYMVVAEVANLKKKTDWNLMWLSVSDMGLVVKQAPEKTVVRAIDLNTLKPLANVDVSLLDRSRLAGSPLLQGKTGSDGFASFPVLPSQRKNSNYYYLAMGAMGANRAFGGIDYWNDARDNYQTYFYTERPIYRLGQMVYFKGISRLKTPDGFKTPKAGLPLHVVVEDPDNNKVWEGKLMANAHGTFNGTYQVPADGKTGAYQITVHYPDGTDSYHRFEVAQYRKPEYQVDVIPLSPRITAGSKGKARVRANYYFGAPVANARIKYSVYADTDWSARYNLMSRPGYYGYYDDWEEDEEYGDNSYAGAFITEGYAQTDASGEALIEFDTTPAQLNKDELYGGDYMDKRYTIQAEVTDLSRIAVVGSGTESVTSGDFALFVQPENYVSKAGEPVKAQVTAVDYQGKPVANRRVAVSLVRWNWDKVKSEYRGSTTLGNVTITTDSQGKALVTLPTTDKYFTDGYYITAEAHDDAGHGIYDQSGIWIASENYPYVREGESAQQEAFSVKLDKKVYQPGEVAKAMITAPVSGKEHGQVIVSVEGAKLHSVQVVPMDATAKLVELPLKTEFAPNVYVTATFVGPKHQFYNQSEIIKVSPASHFLNLSVSTDKPKYKPGETATYTVKATYPNGKPAKDTEVSLGVVDESIYAIRPDAAKDIRKFFYDRIENAVSTFSTFPEEYSGGPDKIEPRVRKDFRDMAAWLPNLTTNANGIATAKIKLPDNLTTWRATVRGVSMGTDVGSAISKVLATQDLIVRLALPRFFTQHDQGYLTAIVHNYTEQPQHVTLSLAASPQFKTKESLVRQLTLKPDGAERYGWPVDITLPGEGLVKVKAVGQTAGDAMELKIPLRPLGIEVTEASGGILKADSASVEIPVKIPVGTSPELARILLSVSASAIGPVLGGFDSLIDYPYGCTEQTMSRLMPSVLAVQLSKNLHVPMDAQLSKRYDAVLIKSLAKLRDYHNADGGWGWWQFDASNAYLTAYVMEGLHLLRKTGASLPEGLDAGGVEWLKKSALELTKQLGDPKIASDDYTQRERLIDLAYMQYALSLYQEKSQKPTRKFLLSQLSVATPEALSYMTLAFKRLGDEQAANQTYSALNRLADESAGMRNWDHTAHLQKLLNLKDADYTYRFTGVESTALALRATVAMEAPNAKVEAENRLEAIEQWLILQHDQNGWGNTKTTAQVLRALMEKAVAQGKAQDTHFTATSNLWRSVRAFTEQNLYAPEQIEQATLADWRDSSIQLSKQGLGRLYYTSLLNYMLPLKPGASVTQKAMPEGLNIRRRFYRIEAEPVGPQGALRLKTHEISDNRVKAGETVLMKVLVESPVALPYVIVDASLPSGGEVVSNDPRVAALQAEGDSGDNAIGGDWGNWWWAHQDILDDRVVMFATSLPAGKSEFHALVRLELPGTFQMNPILLEGMYSKRVKAYSGLDQVQVSE